MKLFNKYSIVILLSLVIGRFDAVSAQSWDNMDNGLTGTDSSQFHSKGFVQGIINFNNKILATGHFLNASGSIVNNVAQWDGSHWQSMGVGLWGYVGDPKAFGYKFISYNDTLYIAGGFSGSGGVCHYDTSHITQCIAKWDGLDWKKIQSGPLRSGLGNSGTTLSEYRNNLYIGGGFNSYHDQLGIHLARGLVRWNDTVFSNCGYFTSNGTDWLLHASFVYNNELIEAGEFNSIDGSPYGSYGYVAAYNDTAWSTLSTGLNAPVYALTVFNGELYAGGNFTATGDGLTPLNHIAKWDGTQWSSVGEGFNDTVYALTVDSVHNKLYAGGNFTQTGLGITAKHLAEWNGVNWVELGGGTNQPVITLYTKDSNLYVGGEFTQVGNGITANHIARWGPSHVGVDDISASSTTMQLEIYPNPSSGEFKIESTSKIESIKVFNVLGETIYETTKDNLQATINLSSQPKGIYFVQVKTEKGILNRKIVIQ